MHKGKDLTEVRSDHKETRAGHVGLEPHEPTSLRGIANRAKMIIVLDAKASTTEEPDAGKLHVRDCAGGPMVTEVPTVRGDLLSTPCFQSISRFPPGC